MRKIIPLLIFVLIMSAAITFGDESETEMKKVYYVDSQIYALIGIDTEITKDTPQKQAQELIEIIINGHDENEKILRVIPKINKVISVKVKDNTAYVNIKSQAAKNPSRDKERLIVYSIVNTLTGVDGIDVVRFTVDGKLTKKFMGFLDMREAFVANYLY